MVTRQVVPTIDELGGQLIRPYDTQVSPMGQGEGSHPDPYGTGGTTQLYPLGTLYRQFYAGGERWFRYVKNGATLMARGKLYQSKAAVAGHTNRPLSAVAAGATTIDITPTTTNVAANEYQNGWLHINDVDGEGIAYRVKSHPAITADAAGTITLYDPIKIATTANSEGTLTYNPYEGLIVHPSPLTAPAIGVPLAAIAASAFGWVQTKGPCAVLTQGTIVAGDFVVPSATVDGAVMPSAAVETDGPPVGKVMSVNADTEYSIINLSIDD